MNAIRRGLYAAVLALCFTGSADAAPTSWNIAY